MGGSAPKGWPTWTPWQPKEVQLRARDIQIITSKRLRARQGPGGGAERRWGCEPDYCGELAGAVRGRAASWGQGCELGVGLRGLGRGCEGVVGLWQVSRPSPDFQHWDLGHTLPATGLSRGGVLSLRLEL